MSADHDPLLDDITAYAQTVECMGYLEVDEWPDYNCVVKWSDLPDLIARVRADERVKARERVEALLDLDPCDCDRCRTLTNAAAAAGGDAALLE